MITDALLVPTKQLDATALHTIINSSSVNSWFSAQLLIYCVFTVYLIGFFYKANSFVKNLKNIYGFIKRNSKIKESNYWIVSFTGEIPAFSFFNYIFINNNYKKLSAAELQIIKAHEIVHIKQYHTLDVLFIELVGIVFWFNPLLNYIRRSIQEIHEFIVDERIAGQGQNKKDYAHLLLNLASDNKAFNLVTNFTGEHIKRRILMMAKPRTSPKYKLSFFVLVPITAILLLSFSCSKDQNGNSPNFGKISSPYPISDLAELQKYSGLYLPSKKDSILVPMDILFLHNKLYRFLEESGNMENRMIELQSVADRKFSYMDNSNRQIEFILDDKNEVKGCILTRADGTFGLVKQK